MVDPRILLLITFVLSYTGLYAQRALVTYETSFRCEKLSSDDTIQFNNNGGDGNPYYKTFPNNSNIAFKTDVVGVLTLHTSSAEISNDSLTIYLTRPRFARVIDVKIFLFKDKPSAEIIYWTRSRNQTRHLNIKKITLILTSKELKLGDNLIGKVNIKFSGKIFDENALKDRRIKGEIDGCFNVQINKLLRSKLD